MILGPKERAQNKAKLTHDHGGRQRSTLEVRRNTSGARATTADALATSLLTRLPLFAKKKPRSRCTALAPQGPGPICYIVMLSQMWAGATDYRLYSQGDGHADHECNNQLYIKSLQQVLVSWGQR